MNLRRDDRGFLLCVHKSYIKTSSQFGNVHINYVRSHSSLTRVKKYLLAIGLFSTTVSRGSFGQAVLPVMTSHAAAHIPRRCDSCISLWLINIYSLYCIT